MTENKDKFVDDEEAGSAVVSYWQKQLEEAQRKKQEVNNKEHPESNIKTLRNKYKRLRQPEKEKPLFGDNSSLGEV